ncbi:MAG: IS1595 family transposase [Phycisphaerales bacterium]
MSKSATHLAQSEIVEQIPLACADESAALALFEAQRWGDTPCCVHCGDTDVYTIMDRTTGKRRTDGRWRCRGCGKQYTVRVGQIMEDSPIPLRKWAYAFWCAASAKNGVSALEMSRKVQVTYKSALYMMNRIRWAMRPTDPQSKLDGTVEVDETYVGGRRRGNKRGRPGPASHKTPVLALVQRGGHVRAAVVANVTAKTIGPILRANVSDGSTIVTDDFSIYPSVARAIGRHQRVRHSTGEYVNATDPTIHTNTIEGFFSRIKRQIGGTYHAVSKTHLHRYVTHAAYLYNGRAMNDGERLTHLIRSADGKRLTYAEATLKAA